MNVTSRVVNIWTNLRENTECYIKFIYHNSTSANQPYLLITSATESSGRCRGKAILEFYTSIEDVTDDVSLPVHTSVLSCIEEHPKMNNVYYQASSTLLLVVKTSGMFRMNMSFTGEKVLSQN